MVGTPKAFIAAFHATSFTDVVPAIINTGTIVQSSGSTLRIPSISSTYCCSALARASSRYLGSRSEVPLG